MWLASAIPFRINWTTPAPLGVYSMHDVRDLTRNDWVAVGDRLDSN